MAELNSKYKNIISDLEKEIKDKEQLDYVKEKFAELSMFFIEIIDKLTSITNERFEKLEENQNELNSKLSKAQKILDSIENDIYADDDYEFEIICPYCNYQFTADIDAELKDEIQCPECNNMIELDWNEEDEGCYHECAHCSSNCLQEDEEEYDDEKDENEDEDM